MYDSVLGNRFLVSLTSNYKSIYTLTRVLIFYTFAITVLSTCRTQVCFISSYGKVNILYIGDLNIHFKKKILGDKVWNAIYF